MVLDELGAAGLVDWSWAVVDAATVRAKRGSLTGPNPVDRAKTGAKIRVLTDRAGLPLIVGVSAADLNDHLPRRPWSERSRRCAGEAAGVGFARTSSTRTKPTT